MKIRLMLMLAIILNFTYPACEKTGEGTPSEETEDLGTPCVISDNLDFPLACAPRRAGGPSGTLSVSYESAGTNQQISKYLTFQQSDNSIFCREKCDPLKELQTSKIVCKPNGSPARETGRTCKYPQDPNEPPDDFV